MFTFKKGRPCFGHNIKRLRPPTIEDLNDVQEGFEQEYDLPEDNDLRGDEMEDHVDEDTGLEAFTIDLEETILPPSDDQFPDNFTELLRGAKLLQGSLVTVYYK